MNTLRLTEKQLDTLRNVKEIDFKLIRHFGDYNLASANIIIDISKVCPKLKELLKAYFNYQFTAKRTDRVKTISIYNNTIKYRALHGCGYAWSQDLEGSFSNYLISKYNLKSTSKTYKLLLENLFSF